MKKSVVLKFFDGLEIEVIGNYYQGKEEILYLSNGDPGDPGEASEFIIEDINIITGNLLDLIDCLNGNKDLLEYLTNLSVKQIEEE